MQGLIFLQGNQVIQCGMALLTAQMSTNTDLGPSIWDTMKAELATIVKGT
jgi:hypothetical protein